MRLSHIQPQYFPRLHFFARMLASDIFAILDDVQFVRTHKFPDGGQGVSHQAHTPIKAPNGIHLLTVPVKKSGFSAINRTGVSYDQKWQRKHIESVRNFYRRSPNLRRILPELELLLSYRFSTLADLDIATICWGLSHLLGAPPRIPGDLSIERVNQLLDARRTGRLRRIVVCSESFASESYESTNASERIVSLCKAAGADRYIAGGTAARAYLDADLLRRNGIELMIQDWDCPRYPQQYMAKAGFIANLSILDLLMNAPAETITSSFELAA